MTLVTQDRPVELFEISLEHRQIVCPTHGEPLRAQWPLGWDTFSMAVAGRALESPMLQRGVADPAYWKHDELLYGDLPPAVGVAVVRQMLNDRPCCEWLRPEELLGAYLRAGIGRQGVCRLCGIARPGTPYGVLSGRGREVIPHLCFVCVATGRTR